MNVDKYPIDRVDYELKSKTFAKQMVQSFFGQADRKKIGPKEFETLIWHTHLLGTLEVLIQFLANSECYKTLTKDELLGEMQIFYVRQAREYTKTSKKHFGKNLTLEDFIKELSEIKFVKAEDGSDNFIWKNKIF